MSVLHEYEYVLDRLMDHCDNTPDGSGGLPDVIGTFMLEELELYLEGQPFGFIPEMELSDEGGFLFKGTSRKLGTPVFKLMEHTHETTDLTRGMGALTLYEQLTALAYTDVYDASNLYKVVRIMALFPSVQMDLSTLLVQEYSRDENQLKFSLFGDNKRIRFILHLDVLRQEADANAVLHCKPTYDPTPTGAVA